MKKTLSLVLAAIMLLSVFSCVSVVKAEAAEQLSYMTYEHPEGKFSLCENTGGYWSYVYDEETEEYKSVFIYDYFDLWQDGAEIEVMYLYEPSDVATYFYTCVDGEFVDEKGRVLDSWELDYTTDQETDPWSVGTHSLTVIYDGGECEVPVEITESTVESVEFVPVEPIELIQNVDGFKYKDDTAEFFYYDYDTPFYAEGNKLNVTFKDGSRSVYTSDGYSYFDENGNEVYFYDIVSDDTQEVMPWTELGEYSVEYYFMGCKFPVPVKIMENPVESISFNSEKPVKYYENTNGMWYPDYEDDGEYFAYDAPLYTAGTSVTVTYNDATTSVYTYNAEKYDYINESGEFLSDVDVNCYSDQSEKPWEPGEHKFTLEIFDKTCYIPVTIIENPVTDIEFTTAKPIVFKYGEGGEWVPSLDENYEETEVYIYNISSCNPYEVGNTLILTLEDGSKIEYVYSAEKGDFADKNGNVIPYDAKIAYEDIQFFIPWDETSPYNYIAVEYMGAYNVVPVVINVGLTSAPEIFSVNNGMGSVSISWEPVVGAVEYRVYRKEDNAKGWEYLSSVADCFYEDTKGIKNGVKYTYTVRGVNPDGKYGDYNKKGVTTEYISPVQGVKVENLDGNIKISWKDYSDIYCNVYKYTDGDDGWTFLISVEGEGYSVLDSAVESGKEYRSAVSASRNGYESGYETAVIKYLAAPKLKSVANTTSGINVKWNAVKGAEAYRVYRKGSTGGWTLIGTTEKTSYTDTAVANKSGNTYKYTVRAVSGKTLSSYNKTGLSIKRLGTPEVSSIANSANGVTLKWSTVKGADGYRVYRRIGDGKWTYLETTSKAYYTDTAVKSKSGVEYNYTVRATYGKIYGDYNRDGWDIIRLAAPALKSTENDAAGAKVTWGKVKGADSYYLYRKTKSTSWKLIAKVEGNANTSYVDKAAESGILYTYTVKAVNGKCTSAYVSEGISLKYLAAPKITVKTVDSGINVKWNKPVGTKDFRIYRKAEGETKWTILKDTTSTSYTDKTVKSGVTYRYAVRAKNDEVVSGFNQAALTFISTPKVKSVANKTTGIELKWNKVAGVDGYRVYRKTGDGKWEILKDTQASVLSFIDETAVAGETYSYTVKGFKGKCLSNYIASSQIIRVNEPEIALQLQENGVLVGWKPVEGADRYAVYRKLDGAWEKLAVVNSEDLVVDETGYATYSDEKVDVDLDYYYTVKAFNGSFASSYVADCNLSDIGNIVM